MYKIGFNNNVYVIDGEVTHIYITNKKGKTFDVLIDTEDLPRLIEIDYSWHTVWHKYTRDYYVRSTVYFEEDGKRKVKLVYLHNFLMNCPEGFETDHKIRNGLDNRKENLRIVPKQNNDTNRKGKNINNKSGYRNVLWDKSRSKWKVGVCINYKHITIGWFDDVHEAGKAAEEAREKYFGEFKGVGY